jgi:O-antigen/teichoic acid export membrane protein
VLWQVKNKPVKYGIFQILQTTVNLTLSLILVIYLQMDWEGRASGIVITFISFGMIALYSLVRSRLVIFNINWSYIKIALRFGIPLIPHTIGGLLIVLGDRFIIAYFLGVDELGLYFVGIQVALVLSVAIDGFSKAYFPWLSAKLPTASQQEKKAIVHLTYKLFIGIIASATIYSFFVYHLFPLVYMVNVLISIGLTILLVSIVYQS